MSQGRAIEALDMWGIEVKSLLHIQWSKNEILGHLREEGPMQTCTLSPGCLLCRMYSAQAQSFSVGSGSRRDQHKTPL